MLAAENKPGAASTRYGAYLRLQNQSQAGRSYLISQAVIVLASCFWLAVLLFNAHDWQLAPWLVTLGVTSLYFACGICSELSRRASLDGYLTQTLAITYVTLSMILAGYLLWQSRQAVVKVVLPRQVVEIELSSPSDYSDQKQVLPGTVKQDSLRRRKSPDRITRPGQEMHSQPVVKLVPAKKQAVGRPSADGKQATVPQKQIASKQMVPVLPSVPQAVEMRRLPEMPGWKTVTVDNSYRKSPAVLSKPRAFMQEVVAPELVELVNNDGDHSLNLWQDGGSSKGGNGRRNLLAEYLKQLNRRIKAVWSPPRGETRSAEILFRINRQGQLVKAQLLRTSGDAQLDQSALSAVSAAAPFKPLPADYPLAYIDIQYNFNYSVNQLEEVNHLSAE